MEYPAWKLKFLWNLQRKKSFFQDGFFSEFLKFFPHRFFIEFFPIFRFKTLSFCEKNVFYAVFLGKIYWFFPLKLFSFQQSNSTSHHREVKRRSDSGEQKVTELLTGRLFHATDAKTPWFLLWEEKVSTCSLKMRWWSFFFTFRSQ